ncbi:hypothetical protein [Mesorhizobium sp. M0998]|uniref:hypothetical protein n=1 Tax=Mesorhizobium sp. M0998 TaxID=2957044 RepID=UPI00333E0693
MLQLHFGTRRAGPLFRSREREKGLLPYTYSRRGSAQIVRDVARKAGNTKRIGPHLFRRTMTTKLLALVAAVVSAYWASCGDVLMRKNR